MLGCEIDRLDMAATVARCESFIADRQLCQHVSINVAKLDRHAQRPRPEPDRQRLRDRHRRRPAGGVGVAAARDPLPSRVAGIDLMWRLLQLAERQRHRIFILGARGDVLQLAVERIRARHPQLIIAGAHDGYFTREQSAEVADEIAAARPDILFVAMQLAPEGVLPRPLRPLARGPADHGSRRRHRHRRRRDPTRSGAAPARRLGMAVPARFRSRVD